MGSHAGRITIISNPVSGGGRRSGMLESVVRELRARGIDATVLLTQRSGDAQRLATEAATADDTPPYCVVACGGDGTIQEVASALAPLKATLGAKCPALGLVPTGRCNDLACALGLVLAPRALAEVLAKGEPVPIDLGRVNGRYFCTVATMGFDAAVSRFVDGMKMPLTGTLAYLYGAARVFLRYKPDTVKISGDFEEVYGKIVLASSANTATYGGSVPIAPGADPRDGRLDLCVIKAIPKYRLLPLLIRAVKGKHIGHPAVKFIRADRFRIETDTPQEIWADGEWISITPATIDVVPDAIKVMLPRG